MTPPGTIALNQRPKFVAYEAMPTPRASPEPDSIDCALRLRDPYDGVTRPA